MGGGVSGSREGAASDTHELRHQGVSHRQLSYPFPVPQPHNSAPQVASEASPRSGVSELNGWGEGEHWRNQSHYYSPQGGGGRRGEWATVIKVGRPTRVSRSQGTFTWVVSHKCRIPPKTNIASANHYLHHHQTCPKCIPSRALSGWEVLDTKARVLRT